MRKSLGSELGNCESLLYSFSSISINSDNAKPESCNFIIDNLIKTKSESQSVSISLSRNARNFFDDFTDMRGFEFMRIVREELDLCEDNFRNEFIERLMNESGSKHMQKIIIHYGKTCSKFIFPLVSFYSYANCFDRSRITIMNYYVHHILDSFVKGFILI